VSPLWPALALAACVVIAGTGLALVRSVPAGSDRLLGLDVEGRKRSPILPRIRAAIGRRFGRTALVLMSQKRRALIRHRLDAAGRPGGLTTVEAYASVKAASTVLFGLGGLVLGLLLSNPVLVPLFAALGWMQTDFAVAAQARRRQARIERDLPDFLDVLALTVGAGLGFRTALARVSDMMGGPLGQEVRIALQQMGYGAARRSAFEGIRDRNDSESLSQFMTALLQAEELGAPLADTLDDIAEDMRKSFAQRARREAARAVPRVSLITTMIIVPAVVVLLLAAMYIGSGLAGGGLFG
jgi:tight adherence protein C